MKVLKRTESELESGIFSSEAEKIIRVMEALKEFLQVPVE